MPEPHRAILLAAILFLAGTTSAPAARCIYQGRPSSDGALVCQIGIVTECRKGRWVPTARSCAGQTAPAPRAAAAPPPKPSEASLPKAPPAAVVPRVPPDVILTLRRSAAQPRNAAPRPLPQEQRPAPQVLPPERAVPPPRVLPPEQQPGGASGFGGQAATAPPHVLQPSLQSSSPARRTMGTVFAPGTHPLLRVLSASYTVAGASKDVLADVRARCDGKPSCNFVGDQKFLNGDPAPRMRGRFVIAYQCYAGRQAGDTLRDVFDKYATISLNCEQ